MVANAGEEIWIDLNFRVGNLSSCGRQDILRGKTNFTHVISYFPDNVRSAKGNLARSGRKNVFWNENKSSVQISQNF